jgi:hypothetical protein
MINITIIYNEIYTGNLQKSLDELWLYKDGKMEEECVTYIGIDNSTQQVFVYKRDIYVMNVFQPVIKSLNPKKEKYITDPSIDFVCYKYERMSTYIGDVRVLGVWHFKTNINKFSEQYTELINISDNDKIILWEKND